MLAQYPDSEHDREEATEHVGRTKVERAGGVVRSLRRTSTGLERVTSAAVSDIGPLIYLAEVESPRRLSMNERRFIDQYLEVDLSKTLSAKP